MHSKIQISNGKIKSDVVLTQFSFTHRIIVREEILTNSYITLVIVQIFDFRFLANLRFEIWRTIIKKLAWCPGVL